MRGDSVCSYPGVDGVGHGHYIAAGATTLLVQTFSATEPLSMTFVHATTWGVSHGYAEVIPMVGVFRGASGYADAGYQAAMLGPLPRHCYLVEQSGWLDGGYQWRSLMKGADL